MFFGFQFYKQPNILSFKHKRTEYKKKEQLSNTIKKSRAININKKHTSPKVTYKDQKGKKRRLKIIDDSNTKQNLVTPG